MRINTIMHAAFCLLILSIVYLSNDRYQHSTLKKANSISINQSKLKFVYKLIENILITFNQIFILFVRTCIKITVTCSVLFDMKYLRLAFNCCINLSKIALVKCFLLVLSIRNFQSLFTNYYFMSKIQQQA